MEECGCLMGAERHTPQFEEYEACDECGVLLPPWIFHLHKEWSHPSLWQRIVGRAKRFLSSEGNE